jgi:2-polyprenyl-3-methyl-5-hydroxy-6-metoxy-1,4-benzoquinol methylase
MINCDNIRDFYDQYPFPGEYSYDQLRRYVPETNPYISIVNQYIRDGQTILDVGCGTGFITNLIGLQHDVDITGVDFSTGADYADTISQQHDIVNCTFVKQDFMTYHTHRKFDVIIAQSVLNHMPDYKQAIAKIKKLLAPGGTVIVGVYNTWGQRAKKLLHVEYGNKRLRIDQEFNPYEIAFTDGHVRKQWRGFVCDKVYPSYNNRWVGLANLFNGRNGGLTVYVFKDQ